MAGSTLGNIFKITTWGESHGKALGVVVDGCPAGLPLSEEDIQKYLDRRKPGTSAITTQRKEADQVELLSGIFEGKTTGTPISLMVRNTSQISAGRETVGRVAAGAIAAKILEQMGITVFAYTRSIGPVDADLTKFNRTTARSTITAMPDAEADEKACAYLQQAREACDSVGGCMECLVEGLPAGIGDPVFEKLDANLAKAIMSIGAVKAVEIGDGAEASRHTGSENNDPFRMENGKVTKISNHSGGILGGMSDGSPIIVRAYVKPTPSIFRPQQTVNRCGENTELTIRGRHDPIIVPRAVVVMECMTAITVLDAMMMNMSAKLDSLVEFYR